MQTGKTRRNLIHAIFTGGLFTANSFIALADSPATRTVFDAPNHFIRSGADPAELFDSSDTALRAWQEELRRAAGIDTLELREVWQAPLSDNRRTVHAYQQYVHGLPVEPAVLRVVVAEDPAPAVQFAIGLVARHIPGAQTDIGAQAALRAVAEQSAYRHLTNWSVPQAVIYLGENGAGLPTRVWRLQGDNGAAAADHDRRTFFVAAEDGRVLGVRDEILKATVSGNVFGYATPGLLPDISSNPPTYQTIPDIIASTGSATDVTGAFGEFALATGGSLPVNVSSTTSQGATVIVHNTAGADLLTSAVFTPGVSGALTLNVLPGEFSTAQLNAFLNANMAHDFFRARSNFTAIDAPVTALVNQTGMCNAYFDGSLNFFRAQPGCADSAYSTLVAHEYGHYIVSKLGLGQGGFGEGFADSLAMLLFQTPVIGDQYYSDGSAMRNSGTDGRQYPCTGEIHYCGELLAGVWWDIRQNLIASYGSSGQNMAAQLFVDWAQITGGGGGTNYTNSAYPQTAIEVLTVDDDDDDLSNGTPNYSPICAAFSAHGIACPPVPQVLFNYQNGLPAWVSPNTTHVVPVSVRAGMSTPVLGSATFSYSVNGGPFNTVGLTNLGNNSYQATLPALACGARLRYYFSARAADGTLVNDPSGAAAAPYVTSIAQSSGVVFSDDFETDRGWVGAASGDTATSGRWERADPQGTAAQPEDDHSANGTLCWVTGSPAGSSSSSYDVDGGTTTLLSPVFDFSGTVDVIIGYWRWYSNSTSSPAPNEDVFDVSVTSDLNNWTLVERIGPTGVETQGGWYYHEFRLSAFVAPSSTVRLRFVASDLNGSSTVEALIDDVQVTAFLCTGGGGCTDPRCAADTNGDCLIDLHDLVAVLAEFGLTGVGMPGDLNHDGRIDISDLGALLSSYGNDCR